MKLISLLEEAKRPDYWSWDWEKLTPEQIKAYADYFYIDSMEEAEKELLNDLKSEAKHKIMRRYRAAQEALGDEHWEMFASAEGNAMDTLGHDETLEYWVMAWSTLSGIADESGVEIPPYTGD